MSNHSIFSMDRATHLKAAVVGLGLGALVALGVYASLGELEQSLDDAKNGRTDTVVYAPRGVHAHGIKIHPVD